MKRLETAFVVPFSTLVTTAQRMSYCERNDKCRFQTLHRRGTAPRRERLCSAGYSRCVEAQMSRRLSSQSGFSLVEMMVSIGVFMVLAGAAFGLLIAAQPRQGTGSELLDSFQAARLRDRKSVV